MYPGMTQNLAEKLTMPGGLGDFDPASHTWLNMMMVYHNTSAGVTTVSGEAQTWQLSMDEMLICLRECAAGTFGGLVRVAHLWMQTVSNSPPAVGNGLYFDPAILAPQPDENIVFESTCAPDGEVDSVRMRNWPESTHLDALIYDDIKSGKIGSVKDKRVEYIQKDRWCIDAANVYVEYALGPLDPDTNKYPADRIYVREK